jgi:hypothetical protein
MPKEKKELAQSTIDSWIAWKKRDKEWKKLGPELYKQRYVKLKLLDRKKYKHLIKYLL